MTDVAQVREQLAAAGQRLGEADAARQEALGAISTAMREGKGVLGIKEMAELAGVTRKTAYRLLEA